MKAMINPWANMSPDSARRIDSEIVHNLFWMINHEGNYGLYIKTSEEFKTTETDLRLRGISFIKRNKLDVGELFLILNKQTDWQLFFSVCTDIIRTCNEHKSNEKMVIAVENRLKRWQSFLLQNLKISLPLITQMGLFAELLYLKETLIPKRGIETSLIAWCGVEADKQDFSFSDLAIEVKSYKTSKGSKVTISSAQQLHSPSKALYLVAFGLTESKKGLSIVDLIAQLENLFSKESVNVIQSFEQKLIGLGYMPGVQYESMHKFVCDSIRTFEVSNNFPSILPHEVPMEITSIKYVVDLQLCLKFEKLKINIL